MSHCIISNLELGRVWTGTINHIYASADTELLPAVREVPTNLQDYTSSRYNQVALVI